MYELHGFDRIRPPVEGLRLSLYSLKFKFSGELAIRIIRVLYVTFCKGVRLPRQPSTPEGTLAYLHFTQFQFAPCLAGSMRHSCSEHLSRIHLSRRDQGWLKQFSCLIKKKKKNFNELQAMDTEWGRF